MSASELGTDPDLVRIDTILGHADDDNWRELLADSRTRIDVLRLDQAEAQRSRLRKATEAGTELTLSLSRDVNVRDGDVLHWNLPTRTAVLAHVDLDDVMVIDLSGLAADPADLAMARCVELGHALGNQHWPAMIKGSRVYVPLTVTRRVMDAVMRTHGFAGISYEFAPGAEVIPHLSPHEARRVFGTAETHHHGPPGGSAAVSP